MSIHKSQGQSELHRVNHAGGKADSQPWTESKSILVKCLRRVKVGLEHIQVVDESDTIAYVALSRATSMEGLQVLGFSADKVRQLVQPLR